MSGLDRFGVSDGIGTQRRGWNLMAEKLFEARGGLSKRLLAPEPSQRSLHSSASPAMTQLEPLRQRAHVGAGFRTPNAFYEPDFSEEAGPSKVFFHGPVDLGPDRAL